MARSHGWAAVSTRLDSATVASFGLPGCGNRSVFALSKAELNSLFSQTTLHALTLEMLKIC